MVFAVKGTLLSYALLKIIFAGGEKRFRALLLRRGRAEINKGRKLGGGDMFFMAEVRGASCKYPIRAKGCVREDGEKR